MTVRSLDAAPVRRLYRGSDGRLVGGVATGLAQHLGLPVLWVRVGLVALTLINGVGVMVYGALWILAPDAEAAARAQQMASAPGLAAAERSGLRPSRARRRRSRRGDVGQLVALGVLGVGLLLLLDSTSIGLDTRYIVPLLLAAGGVAVVWMQSDADTRRRFASDAPSSRWAAAVVGGGRSALGVRVVLGVGLLMAGLVLFLVGQGELRPALDGMVGTLVVLLGVAVVLGPWLWRLYSSLVAERRARILTQERADVAAHLHDSVLQTLALIQQQAEDPKTVARLARSQERDLRGWLYGTATSPDTSFRDALARAAAEVEDAHGVPVEVVAVGDVDLDEPRRALLAAAREAIVNAAKHSGAPAVDVYAECLDGAAEVFVRDRGKGFDLDTVPEDRLGVRRSIIDRTARYGGTAEIHAASGTGTEVRLRMGSPS